MAGSVELAPPLWIIVAAGRFAVVSSYGVRWSPAMRTRESDATATSVVARGEAGCQPERAAPLRASRIANPCACVFPASP